MGLYWNQFVWWGIPLSCSDVRCVLDWIAAAAKSDADTRGGPKALPRSTGAQKETERDEPELQRAAQDVAHDGIRVARDRTSPKRAGVWRVSDASVIECLAGTLGVASEAIHVFRYGIVVAPMGLIEYSYAPRAANPLPLFPLFEDERMPAGSTAGRVRAFVCADDAIHSADPSAGPGRGTPDVRRMLDAIASAHPPGRGPAWPADCPLPRTIGWWVAQTFWSSLDFGPCELELAVPLVFSVAEGIALPAATALDLRPKWRRRPS